MGNLRTKTGLNNYELVAEHNKLLKIIKPFFGKKVLDYGCGNGKMTKVISMMAKKSKIFAYDNFEKDGTFLQERFIQTKKKLGDSIGLYSSREKIPEFYFDNVLLLSVLHEDENVIAQCTPYLRKNGSLIVIDHDETHLSFEEFLDWLSEADKTEIEEKDFDYVYEGHTRMTIDDCCEIGKRSGYETIVKKNHDDFKGYPFYVWVGRKIENIFYIK